MIGEAFGASLLKDNEDSEFGFIISAAISSTIKANEEVMNSNITIFVEEGAKLFAISPNGKKSFVKDILKPTIRFPQQFKLK